MNGLRQSAQLSAVIAVMPLDLPQTFFGQFADQPVLFYGIVEPLFRPAGLDAASDRYRINLLPLPVKQRQFSTRLIFSKQQVTQLGWGR